MIATLRRRLSGQGDRVALSGAAVALLLALFAPSVPIERRLFDHVIVLDVTQSMNVPDVQLAGRAVPRLVAAKQALRDALPLLPCGSRVGWGVFTEHRSLLLTAPVEVCTHLRELRATLEGIDGRMAWTGNSEVAKALYAAIGVTRQVPGQHSLVFVTDGHEAPPVNPRYRPRFDGEAGEIGGLIVGVGSPVPSRIPKIDPLGRPLCYWEADEVLQVDPRSLGRGGSLGGEAMVEDPAAAPVSPLPGATPGSEHLSGLREAYLQLLASETGLAYQRLDGRAGLASALTDDALVRPVVARTSLAPGFAALALALLLWRHRRVLPGLRSSRRNAGVQSLTVGMRKTGLL